MKGWIYWKRIVVAQPLLTPNKIISNKIQLWLFHVIYLQWQQSICWRHIWIVAFHFSGDLQFYLNENYNCIYLIFRFGTNCTICNLKMTEANLQFYQQWRKKAKCRVIQSFVTCAFSTAIGRCKAWAILLSAQVKQLVKL